MIAVDVHKADTLGEVEVGNCVINITLKLPKIDVGTHRREFHDDADLIVDALLSHLPGGTVDRVLAKLLERKASLLTVRL